MSVGERDSAGLTDDCWLPSSVCPSAPSSSWCPPECPATAAVDTVNKENKCTVLQSTIHVLKWF